MILMIAVCHVLCDDPSKDLLMLEEQMNKKYLSVIEYQVLQSTYIILYYDKPSETL